MNSYYHLSIIIDEIKRICETAKYNKTICSTLNSLISSLEAAVRHLQHGTYSTNFEKIDKFKRSLENVKEFVKNISQLHGPIIYEGYEDTASIRKKFLQIMDECRTCMKDLDFRMVITATAQRRICRESLRNCHNETEQFIMRRNKFLIENKNLNRGLYITIFERKRFSKFKFDVHPETVPYGKIFQMSLIYPITTQKDYLLLEDHINPSTISSEHYHLLSDVSIISPTERINKIYLEIQYPLYDIYFNEMLPRELIDKFNNAIEHYNPYHELMRVFECYGHFLPKKVTIGRKLFRMSDLKITPLEPVQVTQTIVRTTIDDFESEFIKIFKLWESQIVNFKKNSYLVMMNGKTIDIKDIQKWASSCLENSSDFNDLQITTWEELCPIYEMLSDPLRKDVKSIIGINDHIGNYKPNEKVLMSGLSLIGDSHYNIITLDHKLNSSDYKVFGKVISQNGNPIETVTVKFKAKCKHSFVAILENIDEVDNSIYPNLQLAWILVGLPKIGYFSQKTRDISIWSLNSHKFKYKENIKIPFIIPETLPKGSIICATFGFPSNCGPNFEATIQHDHGNEFNAIINDSNDHDIAENQEYYLFQWCILHSEIYIIETNNELTFDLNSISQFQYT
ncbi:7527_t:CDS:2 [Dentiscutata erythropus]|uniref:7527_t:CDS:1 n=1 Tax=Dentiscutata erythropus TaxID=1348616 RepID=A0A9N9D8D3_9GLOM|nr:7527_t:CDS:2 [Dentiscutata erythropus]